MRIVKLTAQNVKRLKAVEITPEGAVVVVGGRNAQGKTSVLDAIAYALGGKDLCPDRPIRDGEAKAVATVDLGELVVERTWTAKGTYLTVKNKDGFAAGSPQALLDKMAGRLCFDPLAFTRMAPAAQLKALRELVGLDTAKWDADRKALYERRAVENREAERLWSQAESIDVADAPTEPVSISGLAAHVKEAERLNRKRATLEDDAKLIATEITMAETELKRLNDRKAKLEAGLADARGRAQSVAGFIANTPPVDTAPILGQIEAAEAINAKFRQHKDAEALKTKAQEARQRAAQLSADMEAIDAAKAQALSAAKFPVPGLGFGETGITYNGLPFEQASAAEQLRVSVAMGLALNPKLKVMLIRDGSLLDAENMKALSGMAEAAEAQVWVERVDDGRGEGCSVVIEDGAVKERAKS